MRGISTLWRTRVARREWWSGLAAEKDSRPLYRCGRNFNNIDLLMYDFPSAFEVLEQWLRSHRERHATSNT